ncbi:MAG: LysR substrate-binding domain-containing protein [Sandaracinobacteroides sp.]
MPHRRNIDIDLLRSFVTIIELKSFTRASERLFRTQSAVSLQMKRLEQQLECRLFERGGRGVEPTEAGTLLLGYARRILSANDELVGRMAEPFVEGEVRLGASEGFAVEHLAPALARFSRAFPRVRLKVQTGSHAPMHEAIAAGGLDLLIVSDLSSDLARAAAVGSLGREDLVWCAAQGAELSGHSGMQGGPLRLVACLAPCPLRKAAEETLTASGRDWTVVFETGSRGGVQAAVGAGLGIGVLPRGSLVAGFQRLTPADGFPEMPQIETLLFARPGSGLVAERLGAFLLSVFERQG